MAINLHIVGDFPFNVVVYNLPFHGYILFEHKGLVLQMILIWVERKSSTDVERVPSELTFVSLFTFVVNHVVYFSMVNQNTLVCAESYENVVAMKLVSFIPIKHHIIIYVNVSIVPIEAVSIQNCRSRNERAG